METNKQPRAALRAAAQQRRAAVAEISEAIQAAAAIQSKLLNL